MTIVTIFSAFDDRIGQIPLIWSDMIDEGKAVRICNQVAMSILATFSSRPDDFNTFQGESIVPLVEEDLVALSFYFYMISDEIKEPVFSFILYCAPLSQRDEIYSNIGQVRNRLSLIANILKKSIKLRMPIKEKTDISEELKRTIENLAIPINVLLKDQYKGVATDLLQSVNIIESIACASFNSSNISINIVFQDNIDKDQVKRITHRLMIGLLSRVSEANREGEAILPVFENDLIVFSYFFPLLDEKKTGILLLFAPNSKKMTIYKWAPIISTELGKVANDLRKIEIEVKFPKSFEKRLKDFYFFDVMLKDYIEREKVKIKESVFIEKPEFLFKFKNVDKLLYSLILGKTTLITGNSVDEAESFAELMDKMIPHRDLFLEKEKTFTKNLLENEGLFFILDGDLPKKLPQDVTSIQLDKKKIQSNLPNSDYTKNLVKKIKNLNVDDIQRTMQEEITFLLDEVSRLVETAQLETKEEAKKKIDQQIMALPVKDSFDIIKELAISYNPILSDFIAEQAVYTLRSAIWQI